MICGCGGIGRRAGLRNQYFGVGVQVPSSAPLANLFELCRTTDTNNQSEMVDFFCKKKSCFTEMQTRTKIEEIEKRKGFKIFDEN